jgi:hypothetical protein
VNVAAQVEPAGTGGHVHKRAVVLVQLPSLRHADDAIRGQILEDIREALGEVLEPDDEAVVGLRGMLVYGGMASGRIGSPWARTKIAPTVTSDLDIAITVLLADTTTPTPATSAPEGLAGDAAGSIPL